MQEGGSGGQCRGALGSEQSAAAWSLFKVCVCLCAPS